jgi:hypothetical protein
VARLLPMRGSVGFAAAVGKGKADELLPISFSEML